MSLAGMLDKLYARRRFGIRPGIERVRLLLERLGHPERSFRSIHVVGTNGKGSTSAFLASILQAGGHRTALFTSPHLVDFSERFRVAGVEPGHEVLAARLKTVMLHAPAEATFFEIVTALAAFSFAEEHVDLAVIEAGMGGRSDATAALPGIMTVVTPISMDHSEYLGATLADIAAEKAGIIEADTTAVVASQRHPVGEVIRSACLAASADCFEAGKDFSAAWNADGSLDYRGLNLAMNRLVPGIPGRYQSENAALALAAAELLEIRGISLPEEALKRGLSEAAWPGRMELIPGDPPLLLDGAHNPAGACALAAALADYHYQSLLMVAGVMAEKDLAGILTPLAGLVSRCYCVTPAVERAMADTDLAAVATGMGISSIPCGDVGSGISAALRDAQANDLVLVCGSLFAVGEAKAWLQGRHYLGIRG